MKKIAILAFAAILTFGASSCKKDYTCTCTGTNVGTFGGTYQNVKKSDAKDACSAVETQAKLIDATATCSID